MTIIENPNIGSLQKHASKTFFKTPKAFNAAEMNTRVKHQQLQFLFTQIMIKVTDYPLINTYFYVSLHNTML